MTSVSHRDHFYQQSSLATRIYCRFQEATAASVSAGRLVVNTEFGDLGSSLGWDENRGSHVAEHF